MAPRNSIARDLAWALDQKRAKLNRREEHLTSTVPQRHQITYTGYKLTGRKHPSVKKKRGNKLSGLLPS